MQYSIVNLSEAKQNSDFRIDAEFYHPIYITKYNKINSINCVKFNNIILSIKNGDDFREYVDNGKTYIRTGDFNINGLDLSKCVKVEKNLKSKIKLNCGDLLITRKGNYGKIDVVNNDNINSFISSEIFHIVLKNSNFNSYFIKTYINSKYGFNFIERYIHGISNFSITQESLKEIPIPILSQHLQQSIANLVNTSYSLRQSADNLYQEAENILLEELNLKDYKPQNKKCFIKNLSDTQKAGRFDAEYFQPKYEDVIKKIKVYKGGYEILEYFIKNYSTGYPYKSEEYQDFGIPVIRIANIGKNKLELENNPVFISKKYSNISKKDIAKAGNILISMSGTIGNTAEIPESIGKCCINQRVLSFESENINNKCLVLFLNSFFGHLQFERIGVGGLQINLSYNDVKNLLIPLLSPSTQSIISTKIQESFANRKKSKQLLEIAKRAVEIAIEENEEKGLDYIKNNDC